MQTTTLEIVEAFITEMYENVPVKMPTVRFDLRGHTAGQALLGKWTIRINQELFEREGFEELYDTVGHEIAHLIAWRVYKERGHAHYWTLIMCKFGLSPDRCHTMKTRPSRRVRRWTYVCDCQEFRVSTCIHHKIQRGYTRICKRCTGVLEYTGENECIEP